MTTDENGRLVGWKAIAAYLGKDVRTVLRWERERGLPVHRPPGARGQSVYAVPAELDRWIARPQAQASAQPQQVDAPAQPAAAASSGAVAPRRHAFRVAAACAVGLFALAGAAAVYASRPAPVLARVEIRDLAVRAFDQDGNELWVFPLPANVATPSVENGVGRTTHVGDIDGDGSIEVLASVAMTQHSPDRARALLLCLTARGTLEWAQELDDAIEVGGRKFGPPWTGADLMVFGSGARKQIAFTAHHYVWSPSITTIVSPDTGERRASYVHDGWVMRLGLTSDERHLIGAAVHQSRDAHAVAVLDARNLSPHAYFVVPRPDASVASGETLDRQHYAISDSGVPVVRLVYARDVVPAPEAILELSDDRREVRVTLSPAYREWHDRLAREGRIAHDSRRCPELRR